MFKKLLIPLEFRSLEKKITIVSKFFFFSRLLCLSNVRSCLIFLFSDHLFSFFLFYYPDISFKIIANENCICCYFSTQLKIKLYNFTASKYKMLWIMLFMNHKRPAFCLLCNSRSSTNNKAQMILHRVCPPALIKSPMCT